MPGDIDKGGFLEKLGRNRALFLEKSWLLGRKKIGNKGKAGVFMGCYGRFLMEIVQKGKIRYVFWIRIVGFHERKEKCQKCSGFLLIFCWFSRKGFKGGGFSWLKSEGRADTRRKISCQEVLKI